MLQSSNNVLSSSCSRYVKYEPEDSSPENEDTVDLPREEVGQSPQSANFAGDIKIERSKNVQLGIRNIYQGPVNINQIFNYSSDSKNSTDLENKNKKDKERSFIDVLKSIARVKKRIILISATTGAVCILVSLIVVLFINKMNKIQKLEEARTTTTNPGSSTTDSTTSSSTTDWTSSSTSSGTTPSPGELKIVGRKEWGGFPFDYITKKLINPEYVVIMDTDNAVCLDKETCTERVYMLQLYERVVFQDLRYNFYIGGDGNIYEGRGWDIVGEHTQGGFSNKSLGIALIGDFVGSLMPTSIQIEATKKLLEYAVDNGKIRKDYKLFGQYQVYSVDKTRGLSNNVRDIIKHWDNYVGIVMIDGERQAL